MTDPTPRTEAGRRLLDALAPITTQNLGSKNDAEWIWRQSYARDIIEVEAQACEQHEATLRERGWLDEYEAETNSAMDYGQGMAQARTEALDVERLTVAISTVIKAVDRNPGGLWPVDGRLIAAEYARLTPEETP